MFERADRRPLGRTGLEVTPLVYGAMELRGEPVGQPIPNQRSERVLNTVLDLGINLIDTSIDYGRSEELVGRYLGHRRDEFLLASKCGCLADWRPTGPNPRSPHDYRRDNIVRGLEQSLRRLRTDYLDLLQIHLSPSADTLRADDTVATLLDLREQGKIRHLGISSNPPHLTDHAALDELEVFQAPLSDETLAFAADTTAGVIVRGALRGRSDPGDQLRRAATAPGVSAVVFGTSSPEHARANVERFLVG